MSLTYFLPGLGGSTLAGPGGSPSPWPATIPGIALQVLLGHWQQLRCNPDGTSALPLAPGHVLDDYQLATDALNAVPCPYDWRMSPDVAAAQVRPLITGPGWLVGHSYGGLVALALQRLLQAEGKADWVEGILFWMSPIVYELANWTAYKSLFGQGAFASIMLRGAQLSQDFFGGPRVGLSLRGAAGFNLTSIFVQNLLHPVLPQLQAVLSSFDSIGVLLPTDPPLRQLPYWQTRHVAGVSQAWLDRTLAARNVQENQLSHLPPFSRLYGVYHTGKDTPTGLATTPGAPLYQTTVSGDSVVSAAERPGGGASGLPVLEGLSLIPGGHWTSLSDALTLESIRNVLVTAREDLPKLTPLPDRVGNRQMVFFMDKPAPGGRVTGVFTVDPLDPGPGIMAGPFDPVIGPKPAHGPVVPPAELPPAPGALLHDP